MSEAIFNIVQLAQQADDTTAVAAAVIMPLDAGVVIDADRAPLNPDEDYGENAAAQPGRGSYGVKAATISASGGVRAEDFPEILEMHAAGGISPTGGAGAYLWTYDFDLTADTKTRYTIEGGAVDDADDQWRAVGCLVDSLDWGFDTLTAPGNAPWKFNATIEALYREKNALATGNSAPDPLETFEGHMTSLYEGPVGTAFDSLDELTGTLISIRFKSALSLARRKYGGVTDYASGWGQSARKTINFTAELGINATSLADVLDVYETAGSLMTERRWRIRTRGSRLTTQSEIQVVTANETPTGGTFTLGFEGATTTAIAYDASNATVQAALRALPTIGSPNVTVAGSAGGPWTVTFASALANQPQLLIVGNGTLLTGAGAQPTITVARSQAGGQLKQLTHDFRCRFNTVNLGNRDGERIFTVEGILVKDATLATDLRVACLNGVATLPSA
jgi:hypothetical protein